MSQADDWGDMDETAEEGNGREEAGGPAQAGRLADVGLVEGAVAWPGPGAGPAGSPLAKAREELVGGPGVAHLLDASFATRAEAARAAKAFVDAEPGSYVAGARGCFEAAEVPDPDDGCWHVAVRFVLEGPPAAFLDVGEWSVGWLFPVVRRPLKAGAYWCPQWWEHPEALERLRALWEAWEAARAEGGNAMSYWWTVHFDAHWGVLTDSARGPFAACAKRGQHSGELGYLPGTPDDDEGWQKIGKL
jgi:hypothetical protein